MLYFIVLVALGVGWAWVQICAFAALCRDLRQISIPFNLIYAFF
jgi:hypothetical protein